jgi:hypothetical protein
MLEDLRTLQICDLIVFSSQPCQCLFIASGKIFQLHGHPLKPLQLPLLTIVNVINFHMSNLNRFHFFFLAILLLFFFLPFLPTLRFLVHWLSIYRTSCATVSDNSTFTIDGLDTTFITILWATTLLSKYLNRWSGWSGNRMNKCFCSSPSPTTVLLWAATLQPNALPHRLD